ncbi:hypothetical protein HI113_31610 [Corallococcus exiguus]|uniref:hypothetical protein n=1 Tax=Corallococcus exiguus TaxID=83462 RepID=UPI001472FC8E|nr:hypothetical protein [Corallococcus exiguus]NNB98452.1 hypothetical protein [Corallococcus exiguus]
MIFTLSQYLFQDGIVSAALKLSIFLAGSQRYHVLQIDPPWDEADQTQPLQAWLKQLSAPLGSAVRTVLDASLDELANMGTSVRRVRVEPILESRWRDGVLSPNDALRLMWTPLWLVLENGRTDLQFLRRILEMPDREALDERLADGRIEVPLGGGTGELKWFLEELATLPTSSHNAAQGATGWIRRLRSWIMFDKDAHSTDRDAPSKDSSNLRTLCEGMTTPFPFPGHQLCRRTIENYLPFEALHAWAESGGNKSKTRRKKVNAFVSNQFGASRRACFAMKDGLLKDSPKEIRDACKIDTTRELIDTEVDKVFHGIQDPKIRNRLRTGFGKDIGELYSNRSIGDQFFWAVFTNDPAALEWRKRIIDSLWEVF